MRPNKPVLPTAHNVPNANPLDPMRRQTGQSLDSQRGDEQRPTREQVTGHGQRTSSGDNGQRQRAATNEDSGVTTAQATSATSGDRPQRAAASKLMAAPGVSNKPMVPTAHDMLNGHPMYPVRRHIGRPLGSQKRAGDGLRRARFEPRMAWN